MKTLDKDVCYTTRKGEEELWRRYHSIDEEIKKTTLAMGVSDSIDSDLRENPEFMELRVKAMYALPNQKSELFQKLRKVIIIEDMEEYKNFDGETVIMGSAVTLDFEGEEETYTTLGTENSDVDNNILSAHAPLMEAILYHKVGEIINFNGMEVKIKKVEKVIL